MIGFNFFPTLYCTTAHAMFQATLVNCRFRLITLYAMFSVSNVFIERESKGDPGECDGFDSSQNKAKDLQFLTTDFLYGFVEISPYFLFRSAMMNKVMTWTCSAYLNITQTIWKKSIFLMGSSWTGLFALGQ